MAKLYFYYSAMNAGKSTVLLQSNYNYKERGMDTLLFSPSIDNRYNEGKINSRIGLNAEAILFDGSFDFFIYTKNELLNNANIKCILIDEAQFLAKEQVKQLTHIVDKLNLPVLTYGLRSDYRGEPFPGSMYLLILADNLVEIKTICDCGKKAIMNTRFNSAGQIVRTGEQIHIGGNDQYISMCRKHFYELENIKMIN